MQNIAPFEPKVIVSLPESKVVYNDIKNYLAQKRAFRIGQKPHYECAACNQVYATKGDALADPCLVNVWRYQADVKRSDGEGRGDFLNRRMQLVSEVNEKHRLVTVATVKTELGDDVFGSPLTPGYASRCMRSKSDDWLASRISPDNRGVLWEKRKGNEFHLTYRHYPDYVLGGWLYRRIRTHQERKQHDACQVDDVFVKVRAKRSKASLPTTWDDKPIKLDKCWKRRKVRKQWALNLG